MEDRVIISILISFAISACLCPVVIPFLKRLKFGQYVREDGPQEHLKKSGTPTMGGIIFLISIIITSLIFAFIFDYKEIIPVLLSTIGFAIIGFIDDYIKVVLKRSLGFKAWQKMLCQIVVTVILIVYIANYPGLGTEIIIPFTGGMTTVDLGWFFYPLTFVAVLGTVNGANFTDGLDGLASSVTIIIALFFAYIGVTVYSGTALISGAVIGALLGFLLFNVYPAKVFMGDTGSLAIGGFVASTALMLQMPIFIIIVALIYLIEILSVIIQVTYFKATKGKRIFKMAPIHHHFELCGWSETRVVAVFTIITVICCFIAYLAY